MTACRMPLSRRRFLAAAGAGLLASAGMARAADGMRVATLDWAILETLLAIGANVVAAAELRQFREVAVTPDVPASVMDLGLRGTPNFEALRYARLELIFNSNFYGWADDRMRIIAPVESHTVYTAGQSPYALSETMTLDIGDRLGLSSVARTYVDACRRALDEHKARWTAVDRRPVLPINLGDSRHFRVFGSDSMFGEVLARMGLENAWHDRTSYSATAPVGIDALALMPDAWIVLIPPHPAEAFAELQASRFWQALPAVRAGRVITLGSIDPYGALPAGMRFADLLSEGLSRVGNG